MTDPTPLQALQPCPFCLKQDTLILDKEDAVDTGTTRWLDHWSVVCNVNAGGCGGSGRQCSSEEAAISGWNRRAALPAAAVPTQQPSDDFRLRITADADDWSASHEGLGTSSWCGIRDASGKVVALAVAHQPDYGDPDCRSIAERIVQRVNALSSPAPRPAK